MPVCTCGLYGVCGRMFQMSGRTGYKVSWTTFRRHQDLLRWVEEEEETTSSSEQEQPSEYQEQPSESKHQERSAADPVGQQTPMELVHRTRPNQEQQPAMLAQTFSDTDMLDNQSDSDTDMLASPESTHSSDRDNESSDDSDNESSDDSNNQSSDDSCPSSSSEDEVRSLMSTRIPRIE